MNINTIEHLQHTTKSKRYPTEYNTATQLVISDGVVLTVSDEVVELLKLKPIGKRLVSAYVRTPVYGWDADGDLLPLAALLNAHSPEVLRLRNEPSYIEQMRIQEELPIYSPCCVLRYDWSHRLYFPICYTCLCDFDIFKTDNPSVDFELLKQEISQLPQVYYCGFAPNGKDLFCLVPILAPQRYEEHALALRMLFKEYGIIIRVNVNVVHTRSISTDLNGYFNEKAVEFTQLWH